jgi:SNF2 family DNA or RNA helicase
MAEEFITEIEGLTISAANPAVKRLRLLQITGGFTTAGEQIHDEKVKRLSLYADDLLAQGEHLIVYCRYLPEVAAVAKALDKVGYPVADIHGGTKRGDFRRAVQTFQHASSPRALVFQVQTGSLSIELSAGAEVVIYSPPDGWENYYQCTQRVMGPNQKRPVRYTHILARHTLDAAVMAGLAAKEDWHRTLYKDPRRFLYGYAEDMI